MQNLLPIFFCLVIWTVPFLVAAIPFFAVEESSKAVRLATVGTALPVFLFTFVTVAGLLSLVAQKKITRGKFPREPFHPVYFWRRVYGICWTSLYYFKPLYHVVLSVPLLRTYALRLFGYRGSTKITVYPDTWIRDLPLLNIGEGAYLSNRATMGTNMCLSDGTIFVDHISIAKKGLAGHMSLIGPGVKMGESSEVGVGSAMGIRSRLGENAKVGICCMVNHGAVIGARSQVGNHTFIGLRASIGSEIKIPSGFNVPAGAVIGTQEEVERMERKESASLEEKRQELGALFVSMSDAG